MAECPAPTVVTLQFTWRFPFWWKAYFAAVLFFYKAGLLQPSLPVMTEFILRHTRYYIMLSDGSMKRIWN